MLKVAPMSIYYWNHKGDSNYYAEKNVPLGSRLLELPIGRVEILPVMARSETDSTQCKVPKTGLPLTLER